MKKQCNKKMKQRSSLRHRNSLLHSKEDRHPQFIMDKDTREEALESVSLWSDEGFEED